MQLRMADGGWRAADRRRTGDRAPAALAGGVGSMRASAGARSRVARNAAPAIRTPPSAIRYSAGVTLIEILVAVTIIAITGLLVMPSVGAGLDNLRLRTSAERLGSTMRYAREVALRRQSACQVTVDPVSGVVALDELGGAQQLHRAWDIPVGIRVESANARFFVFAPTGAAPAVDVTLLNSRGRRAHIAFDPVTALPAVDVQ